MRKQSLVALLAIAGAFAGSAVTVEAASVLTAKDSMTLYVFDRDVGGKPSCYDACAKTWPAYLEKNGDKAEEGWATVKRTDGTAQWTYDGKPVYFYAPDKKKGDMKGDGIGGAWHVVHES